MPRRNIHEQPSVSSSFEVATNANYNMNFARNKGRWCYVTDIIPFSYPRYGKLRSSVWRRIFVLPSQVILLVTKLTDSTEWILRRILSLPVISFVYHWSRCICEMGNEPLILRLSIDRQSWTLRIQSISQFTSLPRYVPLVTLLHP